MAENGQFIGSIRQVSPEDNPWNDDRICEGRTFNGSVTARIHEVNSTKTFAYVIEIQPGVTGILRASCVDRDLAEGDLIAIQVMRLDRVQQELEFSQAPT